MLYQIRLSKGTFSKSSLPLLPVIPDKLRLCTICQVHGYKKLQSIKALVIPNTVLYALPFSNPSLTISPSPHPPISPSPQKDTL